MKKKLIVAFVVFTAIGLGLFYILTMNNVGEEYETVSVKSGVLGKYVEDVGKISSENVRSYYGNGLKQVATLAISLGDTVKKGQLLLVFEHTYDLEIERVEKQIMALNAAYANELSGADIEALSNARIEIQKLKGDLQLAQEDKERTQILFDNGAMSKVDLDQAINAFDDLEKNLSISQNNYNRLAKGLSKNQREKFEAEIGVLATTVEILERQKQAQMIYADIDGIVTELNTFEGHVVPAGKLIMEIQDPNKKVILVDFMVEDARAIQTGHEAEINDPLLGIVIQELKVEQVYPKAFVSLSELNVEENRQTVKIGLSEVSEALTFGLEVHTRVRIASNRELIYIPRASLYEKDGKHYVRVLEAGDLVEREIQVGMSVDGKTEVREGLKEGEEVLLNYQEN